MRVAVIGAGGRSGRRIIEEARRREHEIVAIARRPDALDGEPVRVAAHDDRAALADALADVDAVVLPLGPTAETTDPHLLRDALATTLDAMRDAGVTRIVLVGSDGSSLTGDPLARFVAKPILNRVLREAQQDHRDAEGLIRASGMRWTVIRPAQLTDGASTRHRRVREDSPWFGYQTTRAALAAAILDALEDDATIGSVYSVTR